MNRGLSFIPTDDRISPSEVATALNHLTWSLKIKDYFDDETDFDRRFKKPSICMGIHNRANITTNPKTNSRPTHYSSGT